MNNMNNKTFLRWVILFSLILPLLSGCGGKGKALKTIEGDPEILYKQGLALFNKRDYTEALKRFEQLKSSFPDSPPYTLWAELKIGDCHFLKKDYVEAIAAYEEFKKTHPAHEEIPYVQYQIGMSYFNQMRTPDRDQTSTKKALSNFEYLVANYPPSLFTEKTKTKMDLCKKQLADHEFYIGNFYYKRNQFQAAANRFEGLLENLPQTPGEDKTLYFLGKSYIELDQWEKAEVAFMKIVTKYPQSPHYKEARVILDKGMPEKKVSLRKTKTKETKKKEEVTEGEPSRVGLVKFEEEGRQPVSLKASSPAPSESLKPVISPKEEMKAVLSPLAEDQKKEDQILPLSPASEAKKIEPILSGEPMKEGPTQAIPLPLDTGKITLPKAEEPAQEARVRPIPLSPPSPKTGQKKEGNPDEEKRMALLSSASPSRKEEKAKKAVLPEPEQAKLGDTGQPIDITSDRVETYSKDNLIVFKGNVMARQKDIVIYADSIEALLIEEGKGIEKVVAGGNVKIQQGLRVANCQKAVFYNLDQRVVLTGDPKVLDGENIVSGDEIIFDIKQNRVEVKGGSSGRGKAKIHPGENLEKLK